MNFKIVSLNELIQQKATKTFNLLGMKEAIHIQDVDFWLVDVKTMDSDAIESYKHRDANSFVLFIVNTDEDIKTLLSNGFSNYIHNSFSSEELKSWYKFFENMDHPKIISLNGKIQIDINKSEISIDKDRYYLTKQEIYLLKLLSKGEFISTKRLVSLLQLNSETSVRTLINRIKKKIQFNIFTQKRNYGYKLNIDNYEEKINPSISYIKELEEQNAVIQKIVDNSSVYIVTFIHKQLYCINKALRELLGTKIIKELWDEENGDFFQLIKHNQKDKNRLKSELFDTTTISSIEIYDFKSNDYFRFKVETYFFKTLDKHLFYLTQV